MEAALLMVEAKVREAIGTSAVGERLSNVVVEADKDETGSDFLRIVLETMPLDGVSDEDLEAIVQSIEVDLSEVDDRFPSVRFSDWH